MVTKVVRTVRLPAGPAAYKIILADGPFAYEVDMFGPPDEVSQEQIERDREGSVRAGRRLASIPAVAARSGYLRHAEREVVGRSARVIAVTDRPSLESAIVERVHASFARQGAMATLRAVLVNVAAGHVAIAVPVEPRLSQQHGFLHAGVVIAALDSACGYAALTLMPDDAEVLTVELKVNLLAPATGDRVVAEGEVVRAGRTLTICRGEAYAEQGTERAHVATMLATMSRRDD
jgi:uncharacterized protein (TIGR00369 family)